MKGETMRTRFAVALLGLGSLLLLPGAAQTKKNHKTSGTKTITGCLQKGDEANEFSITDADGKTYGLRSSSVKLGDHVGHKVTVSGRVRPESEENEASEQREKNEQNEKKEVADIRVTSLKMVSTSCQ
jgi:hypothetical protein